MTKAKHQRTLLLLVVAVAVGLAAVAVVSLSPRDASAHADGATTGSQHMAIPAYFYPNPTYPEWPQMNAAGVGKGGAVAIAVMNPSSGPGTRQNSDYARAVNEAKAAGIKVYGYVYTSYGSRSWSGTRGVKADIDKYYQWYGVDGIFLDEAEYRDCSDETYYQTIYEHIRKKDSLYPDNPPDGEVTTTTADGKVVSSPRKNYVVQNPGTQTQECYFKRADIMVNFEGRYSTYASSSYEDPSWMKNTDGTYKHEPSRFWHLVYDASATDIPQAVDFGKHRNAGYMYVTPDGESGDTNPWNELPSGSYWETENCLLATSSC